MKELSSGLIIGTSIGLVIGVFLAVLGVFCFRVHKKRSQIGNSSSRRAARIPIRANGADASTVLSDSSVATESPRTTVDSGISLWVRRSSVLSASGILEYSYKDLQRATYNFSTLIGQGAYGPVYKAQLSTGESVAVKVLAMDSKQGEKEFQTEVVLLGRLHHRNLVNLLGYCAEKGQNMLIYVYMSKGSLASHLYDDKLEPLSWDLRAQIALDVARGLEYLHDGAVPPVVHRDIKSSNILLDQSMRARGLMEYVELAAMTADVKGGWEEIVDPRLNGKYDVQELNGVSALAYRCVNRDPKKRPAMRDIVQVLSRILKSRHSRKHPKHFPATPEEVCISMEGVDHKSPTFGLHQVESMNIIAESCEV
nr:calcium/calmodulin-regulated receptor-like kinase 1 [Ipomoea batatas]